jgi:hypothetical protein
MVKPSRKMTLLLESTSHPMPELTRPDYPFTELYQPVLLVIIVVERLKLRQLKSNEEFDILMAIHELCPVQVNLSYGLIPPKKVQSGENGDRQTPSTPGKEYFPQECRLNPARDLSDTLISIGTFLNPN